VIAMDVADNPVDAVVCDPPNGLSKEPDIAEVLSHWLAGDDYVHNGKGFMGKSWGLVRSRSGGLARSVARAQARRSRPAAIRPSSILQQLVPKLERSANRRQSTHG
jgi:hypothetical protein